MPEYIAPGVYVEETSFRSKGIEGVSTSVTAFVGYTRRGPLATVKAPGELTSFREFERQFGGLTDFSFSPWTITSHTRQGRFLPKVASGL